MNKAYLLTGGNVGNRMEYLIAAATNIESICGKINKISSFYETAAWGKTDQAPFLNQALALNTSFSAARLMERLLTIEEKLGRKRAEKYGNRTIDIDILLFNTTVINTALVTIPHPQLPNRRFALEPLAEILPNYQHPVLKKSIAQLLQLCPDELPVKKFFSGL